MELNALPPLPVPSVSLEGPCDMRLHAQTRGWLTVLPRASASHQQVVQQDLHDGGRVLQCSGCGRITYQSATSNPRG